MKIHLRADEVNGTHTKVTIFLNGGNCGQLCMREEEALFFHEVIMRSPWWNKEKFGDDVISSGCWFKEVEKENMKL